MAEIRYMSVAEFRREGYLQELNRLFLHPLGLAIDVVVDEETGRERLGGVWDYRDDPEGIRFEGADLVPGAARIRALRDAREPDRVAALGYMVQPDGSEPPGPEGG